MVMRAAFDFPDEQFESVGCELLCVSPMLFWNVFVLCWPRGFGLRRRRIHKWMIMRYWWFQLHFKVSCILMVIGVAIVWVYAVWDLVCIFPGAQFLWIVFLALLWYSHLMQWPLMVSLVAQSSIELYHSIAWLGFSFRFFWLHSVFFFKWNIKGLAYLSCIGTDFILVCRSSLRWHLFLLALVVGSALKYHKYSPNIWFLC